MKNHIDVQDIDWSTWQPVERAVLCFIVEPERIMLIHKKTGLGAGKINAPGGRIIPNESPHDAAIRETEEEIGLTPSGLTKAAELFFVFVDGYSLHGTVFLANSYSGSGPINTIEADPFWCPIGEIPYDRMWEDDPYWLPLVLTGRYVHAYFTFDGDRMLSRRVDDLTDCV